MVSYLPSETVPDPETSKNTKTTAFESITKSTQIRNDSVQFIRK